MAGQDPAGVDRLMLSVIIPTFRREQQLVTAVQSALAIGSEIDRFEVVVVDDSSEHSARSTVGAIEDPHVRYEEMPEPSDGRPALVRNYAIGLAQGRYLYFLDDDDQVVASGLAAMVRALERHPRRSVAYGRVQCVGPDEEIRTRYTTWFDWAARTSKRVRFSSWLTTGVIMFRGTLIINSCCLVRRNTAMVLGGYDASLSVYEDVDFFTRGIRRHRHVYVDEPVLRYSTGLSSIIHDLDGDNRPVGESYAAMHANYKRNHGTLDYRVLQVVSKLMPIGGGDP